MNNLLLGNNFGNGSENDSIQPLLDRFFATKNSGDEIDDVNNKIAEDGIIIDLRSHRELSREIFDVPSNDEISLLYGGTAVSVGFMAANSSSSQTSLPFTNPVQNWSASLQTVLDHPPASLPSQVVVGGLIFLAAFATWASFGYIDEVGKANGLLVPQGEAYKVNPVVSGKIDRIYVQEGQFIKAGQVVAEMDNQIAVNEIERLQQEKTALQTQLIQTDSLIDKTVLESQTRRQIASSEQQVQKSAIASAQFRLTGNYQLLGQLHNQRAATINRKQQIEPLLAKSKQLLKQRQDEVAAYRERVERLQPLLKEGAISRDMVFNAEQELRQRELAITKNQLEETPITRERLFEAEQAEAQTIRTITQSQSEIQQTQTEIKRLESELVQKKAEAITVQVQSQQKIQQLQVEKTQIQAKIQQAEKILEKAKVELKQYYLTAPVDGVVLSLNVHNSGDIVQPGQTVAAIAPQGVPLILKAVLPNSEAGFVKVGETAQVKFDAFPYQDYGIITGKVASISPDVKPNEKLGAVYSVEIELERDRLTANNQIIKFKPGQTATAEIITRHRRIIDVILDPIRQIQAGGINL
ncbi:HlyD family efflux transporter periplasmic adaptor subunit [Brunnivagina elsteri]|uniref:Secretion protein HlyD n=1 Tax=Brunnivagina elsteri CCALA 953 TaxID=987040 RepID=A0A2A2TL42_9CYAN|nr:HlyD family efflux transporter periplasmic adaptor subunit [Calothrix elsteri]PAX57943.1 secretion protein HlyD [Calothrix elsteri CCALA 953]